MIAPFYGQDLLGGPHRSYMPVHDWKKLFNNKGEGLLIGIEHFNNVPDRGASFVGHVPCLEMQAAFSFMVSVHDCSIIIHSIMCNVFDTLFSVIECT
jgi:hypothetical protein